MLYIANLLAKFPLHKRYNPSYLNILSNLLCISHMFIYRLIDN